MYVLGIDAGGTKTICLLADEAGRVISDAQDDGANLQAQGELEVEKVLHHVMDAAIGDRDVRPTAICLGMAGVDRPEDTAAVHEIMRRIGFKARIIVVNDALVALVAGAGDAEGVVVVAGTGSIAYGRDGSGRAARAGGWGYLQSSHRQPDRSSRVSRCAAARSRPCWPAVSSAESPRWSTT